MSIEKNIRAWIVFTGVGLCAAGCASPGLPKAPSLNLPRPATNLTAARRGSMVHLEWSTPDRNTDGLLLDPPASRKRYLPPNAEICRSETVGGTACAVTGRTVAHPGTSESFEDTLPAALQVGPFRLVQYRVRLLNAAGRGAAPATVLVPAGEVPPPTAGLKVRAVRQGAEVAWNPINGSVTGDTVHILRKTVDVPTVSTAARPTPSSKRSKTKLLGGPPSNASQADVSELRLSASPDPGGAVDPTITSGERYLYTVARERSVTVAGHAYTVSSDLSTITTSALEDRFAPRAPAGLASIVTPKSDESKASIDLSWEPNTETDVAGYFVYRKDSSSSTVTKMNPQIQPGTAFHDETVLAGRRYSYWVTAVDHTGNESPRSSAVEEALP